MTESETRKELWIALQRLSENYPQWRIGQLIANAADWTDQGIWDVEDAKLLEVIHRHLSQCVQPECPADNLYPIANP